MSEITSLARRRVQVSEDCREWSVRDCLQAVLDDIESGEIDPCMVVVELCIQKDGVATYPAYFAGGTTLEIQGLIAKHLHDQLKNDDV